MANRERLTSRVWTPRQMLAVGLIFFACSVVLRRVWALTVDDPETWASTLVPSAITAVLWVFSMRWWTQRQRRHRESAAQAGERSGANA